MSVQLILEMRNVYREDAIPQFKYHLARRDLFSIRVMHAGLAAWPKL